MSKNQTCLLLQDIRPIQYQMQDKYSYCHTKDFVDDAYFWSWVTEPDADSNVFWGNYIKENPSKKKAVEEAREIIEQLNQPQLSLAKERTEHIWNEIRRNTPELPDESHKKEILPAPTYRQAQLKNWYRVAAVFVGILVVAFAYRYAYQEQLYTVSTSLGQTREILLPDSSEVILNTNSQISYKDNWEKGEREIWIQGEAFFTVRHLRHDKKFTVYSDGVKVEVLGTEFSVNNRSEKTKVILNSGKVNLVMEGPEKEPREMEMKPGDLIEYSASSASLDHKVVNPDKYLAWTKNKLAFEETTLQEIFNILEDHHGFTIHTNIKNDSILHRKFTGTVPADQINILLQGIARTHDLNISKRGTVISIDSRDKDGKN